MILSKQRKTKKMIQLEQIESQGLKGKSFPALEPGKNNGPLPEEYFNFQEPPKIGRSAKPPTSNKQAKQFELLKQLHNVGLPTWRSRSDRNTLLGVCIILSFRLCPETPFHAFRYAQYNLNRVLTGKTIAKWDTWKKQPENRDLPVFEPKEPRETDVSSGWNLEQWERHLGFKADVPDIRPHKMKARIQEKKADMDKVANFQES